MVKTAKEEAGLPRTLRKHVKETNIYVQKSATDGIADTCQAMLYSIAPDDLLELQWYHNTLRPEKHLTQPVNSFLSGIKALRPAAAFNTFDLKKAKLRRLAKHEKDQRKAMARREREVAPTAAFKAAMHPHRVPRVSTKLRPEERRFFAHGEKRTQHKQKAAGNEKEGTKKKFYVKWRKAKREKIGKGL